MTLNLRVLIIDNYDSYTFNLYQYCVRISPTHLKPVVLRNDQFNWPHIRDCYIPYFDLIILSPGPGTPINKSDFGVCEEILKYSTIPCLGVCLGHQGLASVFGGNVIKAPTPMHGRTSLVLHSGDPLFDSISSPFNAVRYHSLIVDEQTLPSCVEPIAWTQETIETSIIMALRHTRKPIWSVQFHPESICTEKGLQLIKNFFVIAENWWYDEVPEYRWQTIPNILTQTSVIPSPLKTPVPSDNLGDNTTSSPKYGLSIKKLSGIFVDSQLVYEKLFSNPSIPSVWLDSARVEKGLSRFSFMGNAEGPESFLVTYNADTKTITKSKKHFGSQDLKSTDTTIDKTFFHWVQSTLDGYGLGCSSKSKDNCSFEDIDVFDLGASHALEKSDIPFDFWCGFCGYFGYEMKSESLPTLSANEGTQEKSLVPDSSFVFLDRLIVFDHLESNIWLVELKEVEEARSSTGRITRSPWVTETIQLLYSLREKSPTETTHRKLYVPPPERKLTVQKNKPSSSTIKDQFSARLLSPQTEYLDNVQKSIDEIVAGETYEVCLTTQIEITQKDQENKINICSRSFDIYKHLRNRNPAPYGAYLNFSKDFCIVSSSPERFLKIDRDGSITMKPIKGTVARSLPPPQDTVESSTEYQLLKAQAQIRDEERRHGLANSVKDKAENLMIVDLIRNDLNLITEADSVHVPALMQVETYATVHQLVSTIQGRLRSDLSAVDAVMHSFPPGSMTGAPKVRTVQILEEMEPTERGPYSGVLGFMSVHGVAAEFSVVIRSAVCTKDVVRIGAGGAIIYLSDPEDEFNEMLLKADSVLPSLEAILL